MGSRAKHRQHTRVHTCSPLRHPPTSQYRHSILSYLLQDGGWPQVSGVKCSIERLIPPMQQVLLRHKISHMLFPEFTVNYPVHRASASAGAGALPGEENQIVNIYPRGSRDPGYHVLPKPQPFLFPIHKSNQLDEPHDGLNCPVDGFEMSLGHERRHPCVYLREDIFRDNQTVIA